LTEKKLTLIYDGFLQAFDNQAMHQAINKKANLLYLIEATNGKKIAFFTRVVAEVK
jgi:hypothetical protein